MGDDEIMYYVVDNVNPCVWGVTRSNVARHHTIWPHYETFYEAKDALVKSFKEKLENTTKELTQKIEITTNATEVWSYETNNHIKKSKEDWY